MQSLARQLQLVVQPLAQRHERRPLAQARRVGKVIGMRVLVGNRKVRQSNEASIEQRISCEQFAAERQAKILLGSLKHQTGVVENGHGRNLRTHTGRRKPALP